MSQQSGHPLTPAKQILSLLACLALTYAAAGIGGKASVQAQGFYAQLVRPAWAPPAYLFGPVWTLLYTLMGISAWIIWRERGIRRARLALGLFVAQLAFNAVWTWLFFVWRLGMWSFIEILLLWVLIAWTILEFRRIRPWAAMMLVPYLAWVTFASALTLAVWRLNPDLLS